MALPRNAPKQNRKNPMMPFQMRLYVGKKLTQKLQPGTDEISPLRSSGGCRTSHLPNG